MLISLGKHNGKRGEVKCMSINKARYSRPHSTQHTLLPLLTQLARITWLMSAA